jgi:hypothetical protein
MTLTPEGKVVDEPSRERTLVLNEDSLRKAFNIVGPRLPPAYTMSVNYPKPSSEIGHV